MVQGLQTQLSSAGAEHERLQHMIMELHELINMEKMKGIEFARQCQRYKEDALKLQREVEVLDLELETLRMAHAASADTISVLWNSVEGLGMLEKLEQSVSAKTQIILQVSIIPCDDAAC